MSVVAIGTSLALPWVLWFGAGVAFATVIFRNHPAEVLYNRVIRRYTHTVALPPTARERKVALAVAGGVLIGAGFAFFFGATQLGYTMGVGVKLFLRLLRG
jgi:divalent metal cation (Fe/Co/Zn/Cd) transporter